jgi:hypothetical protein
MAHCQPRPCFSKHVDGGGIVWGRAAPIRKAAAQKKRDADRGASRVSRDVIGERPRGEVGDPGGVD